MVARLVLGVVLTAAVLTACGPDSGGQPSRPATTAASSSPTASTVAGTTAACAQQYHAWQNGPAHSAIIKFEAAQQILAKDSSSGHPALIAAALNILGQQAAALASFPVPPCADPHGYFANLLSQVVGGHWRARAGRDRGRPPAGDQSARLGVLIGERLHRRSEADHFS